MAGGIQKQSRSKPPRREKNDGAELHARGYDRGTRVHAALPSNETIIGWAKELLPRPRSRPRPRRAAQTR